MGRSVVLSRSLNFPPNGEMNEEGFNFRNAHFLWLALVMKRNVTNPLNIGFFDTIKVMFELNLGFNLF